MAKGTANSFQKKMIEAQKTIQITEAERLAAESYQRKIQQQKEADDAACKAELEAVLNKYNRQLVVRYVQQHPLQPSIGQVIIASNNK
jgi:ABC-type lipoprotein release transport system permease subunit